MYNIFHSSFNLKQRILRRYPQFKFYRKSTKAMGQVFAPESCTSPLLHHVKPLSLSTDLDTDALTDTEASVTSTPARPTCEATRDDACNVSILYNAAMQLREEISSAPKMGQKWPYLAKDFTMEESENLIPISLYNFLAWVVGISDEPVLNKRVDVPEKDHIRLISVLQDVLYFSSKGNDPNPKSLSLGMTVRHLTGSTKLVDLLHHFGHTASGKTILRLEDAIAQLQGSDNKDVFLPSGFHRDTPTFLVFDNIDFNEETPTGKGTTHFTNGIIVQPFETAPLSSRIPCSAGQNIRKSQQFCARDEKFLEYKRQRRDGPVQQSTSLENVNFPQSTTSLNSIDVLYTLMRLYNSNGRIPPWTGFNTLLEQDQTLRKSKIGYLPVIEASPTKYDTVFTILQKCIDYADLLRLNYIMVVFDMAIYLKAQEIRWNDKILHDRVVVRLGEFHTAMSYLGVIGRRFGSAGLSDILVEADIIGQGSINSVLSGKHYNRAIRAHKIMFEAMQRLKFRAFRKTLSPQENAATDNLFNKLTDVFPSAAFVRESESEEVAILFDKYTEFCKRRISESKVFAFWESYIEMVQLLLNFIRATRNSDWESHLDCVFFISAWMHAYDRTFYARYLPIYWLEMKNLKKTHQAIHENVTKGSWTVQQQGNYPFSATAADQAIEQTLNRNCKTSGGLSGISLQRRAVQRWHLAQSERAAITQQCFTLCGYSEKQRPRKDLDKSVSAKHESSVSQSISLIENMINPFEDNHDELINIWSGTIADKECEKDLLKAKETGTEKSNAYIKQISSDPAMFPKALKRNNLKTFETKKKVKGSFSKKCSSVSDRTIFARLLILGQRNNVDLRTVLSHCLGDVSHPLASVDGHFAKTCKSKLLSIVENAWSAECPCDDQMADGSVLVLDGMMLIHSVEIRSLQVTFGELASIILKKIVSLAYAKQHSEVHVVFDRYPENSIKSMEHIRRAGTGTAQCLRIVKCDQKLPIQWKNYLKCGQNKEELVRFLYESWAMDYPYHFKLNVAFDRKSFSLVPDSKPVQMYSNCDHEEADTRLVLHALQASQNCSAILIKSPDSDVAFISLAHVESISATVLFETGTADSKRIINLSSLQKSMKPNVAEALLGLHVFTGCDTTSAFHGKGKAKAFKIFQDCEHYQEAFKNLGQDFNVSDDVRASLEDFVCKLYGQRCSSVNEARYILFCLKPLDEKSLPPTSDALFQHILRCNYQLAIHRRATEQQVNAPSPKGHGWEFSGPRNELRIKWMEKAPAPEHLLKIVSCSCKKNNCTSHVCSCRKHSLSCTDICACLGCKNLEETVQEEELLNESSEDEEF